MKKFLLCACMVAMQGVCSLLHSQALPSGAAGTDSALFRFVINRGEVFSATAPGEVTELTLSGYFVLGQDENVPMTPAKSVNRYTLTGQALINDYKPRLQTNVVASVSMPAITSPSGLYLTLVVDNVPMTVQLPYVDETDDWKAGFAYTYNVTVEGRGLVISGVNYTSLASLRMEKGKTDKQNKLDK